MRFIKASKTQCSATKPSLVWEHWESRQARVPKARLQATVFLPQRLHLRLIAREDDDCALAIVGAPGPVLEVGE